jgi:hypothetical protein
VYFITGGFLSSNIIYAKNMKPYELHGLIIKNAEGFVGLLPGRSSSHPV